MRLLAETVLFGVVLGSFDVVLVGGRLFAGLRSWTSPPAQQLSKSSDPDREAEHEAYEASFEDWSIDEALWNGDAVPIAGELMNSTAAVVSKGPQQGTWPRVMIIGTQKAATSSLWALLKTNPQLCGAYGLPGEPGFRRKELHFFDQDYIYGPQHYLRHYIGGKCDRKQGMYMDATPSYLREPAVPRRVVQMIPATLRLKLRFIAVLREPMARDLSYFNHEKYSAEKKGYLRRTSYVMHVSEGYETYARRQLALARTGKPTAFSFGAYNEQLKRWFTIFIRSQFLVLNFEDLIYKQEKSIQHVTKFLGVESFGAKEHLPHENAQPFARKVLMRKVPCELRRKVAKYFEPLNAQLYETLEQSHTKQTAPVQEPPFPRFKPSTC